jgi:alpha-glucosidase
VESQVGKDGSTHSLYTQALTIRKAEVGLGDGPMSWIDAGKDVIAFSRPGNFACYVNFGSPIELPQGAEVLLASQELTESTIPTDTTVWMRLK